MGELTARACSAQNGTPPRDAPHCTAAMRACEIQRGTTLLAGPSCLRASCSSSLVLNRCQQSAQNVRFVLIQLGALQEAPDAAHQVGARLCPIPEIHFIHHFSEM